MIFFLKVVTLKLCDSHFINGFARDILFNLVALLFYFIFLLVRGATWLCSEHISGSVLTPDGVSGDQL